YAKGVYPNLSPAAFEWYLLRSAKDMGTAGKDVYSGYGMIDCEKFHNMITGETLQTGEASAPFIINNAKELEIFISILNNGDTDACATINQSFTVPTNFKGYTGTYYGTINGANHRISGLTSTFIDTLGNSGQIRNLYAKGTMNDEAILVKENYGTIYGCVTEGSLTTNDTAGGICAINHGSIYYALNRAKVYGSVVAGVAAHSYGTIQQSINRGNIESTGGMAAGICTYLLKNGSVAHCYNASALKGISNLGGVIHTMANSATVKNCYYGDSKQRTTTHNEIIAKTYDYMRTSGFLCMLNGRGGYFKSDENNANDGFPVWGSSDISTCFYDVAPHKWSADDIYALAADKILNGRSAGYFVPEDNITRAEFLTILAKINGVDIQNSDYGTEPFYDVSPGDWYYNVICWAYNNGLTQGNGNGSCTPNANITREEISAFIVRYIRAYSTNNLPTAKPLTFTDSYNVSSWAQESVSILNQLGIINGFPNGSFGPKQSATREQAAKMTNAMRNEI
ncbi:MAG: S-layer homology domain-containing protein, partial [Firmicutes bacterium]|nr:S-layer homology domain-containing protein [Bacillota bacterium]